MSALYLYDDAKAREFEPFTLTRPVSELIAGAAIIRDRWERLYLFATPYRTLLDRAPSAT